MKQIYCTNSRSPPPDFFQQDVMVFKMTQNLKKRNFTMVTKEIKIDHLLLIWRKTWKIIIKTL